VPGLAAAPLELALPVLPLDNFGNPGLDGGALVMAPAPGGGEVTTSGEASDHLIVRAASEFEPPP